MICTTSLYYNCIYLYTVTGGSRHATSQVFKEHQAELASQLWTKPHDVIHLNRVQEEAAMLTFTKPFQLIQGPPGNYMYLL